MKKPSNLETLRQEINLIFGGDCDIYDSIKGDTTIHIPVESLSKAADLVINHFDYCHLSAITAQVRGNQPGRIEILYHFWCGYGLSLLLKISKDSASVPSISSTIPAADFYEREVAEMFGVKFFGRTQTPPLLLSDDWNQAPPFLSEKENNG